MANGSGPSPSGLIILTGMTIAAVVGLYAYDAIPRRNGIASSADIAWPRWSAGDAPSPAYAPTSAPQQQPPQERGYGPSQSPQYPQGQRGQDVPYDQQNAQGGAGQPPPPDGSQGQ
jgi:hypothetical protein